MNEIIKIFKEKLDQIITVTPLCLKKINEKKLKLQKNQQIAKTYIFKNSNINFENKDIEKISENIINEAIYFLTIAKNNNLPINVHIVKKNILNLNIICTDITWGKPFYGCYVNSNNLIILSKNSTRSTMEHELLHCFSSIIDENTNYVGFCQITSNGKIGVGLNEGYTERINSKYFSGKTDSYIYELEKKICILIENVVGEKKMLESFFNADLYSLFAAIKKESNSSDSLILETINNMDNLINVTGENKSYESKRAELLFHTNYISKDILQIIINNVNNQLINNKITIYEADKKIVDAISSIFDISQNLYKNSKELKKYLNEYQKIIDNNYTGTKLNILDIKTKDLTK